MVGSNTTKRRKTNDRSSSKKKGTKNLPGTTLTHTLSNNAAFAAVMEQNIATAQAQGYGRASVGAGTAPTNGGLGALGFAPFVGAAPPTEDPRRTKRNQDNINTLNAAQNNCGEFFGRVESILKAAAPSAPTAASASTKKKEKLKEYLEFQALAKAAGNTSTYKKYQKKIDKLSPDSDDDDSDSDSASG